MLFALDPFRSGMISTRIVPVHLPFLDHFGIARGEFYLPGLITLRRECTK